MKSIVFLLLASILSFNALSQSYTIGSKLGVASNGDPVALITSEMRIFPQFQANLGLGTALETGVSFPFQADDLGEFTVNPGVSMRWDFNHIVTVQSFVQGNLALDKKRMWHFRGLTNSR